MMPWDVTHEADSILHAIPHIVPGLPAVVTDYFLVPSINGLDHLIYMRQVIPNRLGRWTIHNKGACVLRHTSRTRHFPSGSSSSLNRRRPRWSSSTLKLRSARWSASSLSRRSSSYTSSLELLPKPSNLAWSDVLKWVASLSPLLKSRLMRRTSSSTSRTLTSLHLQDLRKRLFAMNLTPEISQKTEELRFHMNWLSSTNWVTI
jgi:hypothetical protein